MYKNLELSYLPDNSPFHRKSLNRTKNSADSISFRKWDMAFAWITEQRRWIDWCFLSFAQKTTNWDALVNIAQPSLVETDPRFNWMMLPSKMNRIDNVIVETQKWRQRKINVIFGSVCDKWLGNAVSERGSVLYKKVQSLLKNNAWSSSIWFDLEKFFRKSDFSDLEDYSGFFKDVILSLRNKLISDLIIFNLEWSNATINVVNVDDYFPDIETVLDCVKPNNWNLITNFSINNGVWVLTITYKGSGRAKSDYVEILSTGYNADDSLDYIWTFVERVDADIAT